MRVKGKLRDSQRQKLYNAERDGLWEHPSNEPLPTVKDVKRFTAKVLNNPQLRKRYLRAVCRGITVKDGRGCRRALGGWGQIQIPLWARNKAVVCHEIAHCFMTRLHSDDKKADHGPEYARIFLDIVHFMMGDEAEQVLKSAFLRHGVDFKPPVVLTRKQAAEINTRLARSKEQLKEIVQQQAA